MVLGRLISLLILCSSIPSVDSAEPPKLSGAEPYHSSCSKKPWLDLRTSNEYLGAPSPLEERNAPHLYSLRCGIDAYHALHKTDKRLLPDRLKQLQTIQDTIDQILEMDPSIKEELIHDQLPWQWQALQKNVNNRYWYLTQLHKLESQSTAEIFERRLIPSFWGDNKIARGLVAAALSCGDLDPYHRQAGPLYRKWCNSLSPEDPSYFMWLERQDTESMESKSLTSLEEVHAKTKTIFQAGKIMANFLKDPLEGNYLYVLDLDQTLHIYPTELTTRKTTHSYEISKELRAWQFLSLLKHNQFLNGDAVICAGECTAKNGKVIEIDNNSGHYRPSPLNLRDCLEILNDQQVVSHACKITIKNGLEIIKTTASEFLSDKPMIRTAYNSEPLNRMSAVTLKKGLKKAQQHQAARIIQKAWKEFKAK